MDFIKKVANRSKKDSPDNVHNVKVICISDTHSRHDKIPETLADADIIIHGGDFTNVGTKAEITEFMEWFSQLPYKKKLLIAGNHDITLEEDYYVNKGAEMFHQKKCAEGLDKRTYAQECKTLVRSYAHKGVIYLEDELVEIPLRDLFGESVEECMSSEAREPTSAPASVSATSTGAIRAYGSPWQPWFYDWGFNLKTPEELRERWVKIPDDVDILITHGPPSGILDMTSSGQHAGCSQLVDEVMNRVRPRVHIFGHIHETYGIEKRDEIVFVNASTCTYNYKPTNPPVEFIIPIIVSTGDTEEAVKAPKVTILNQGEKSKGCTTH